MTELLRYRRAKVGAARASHSTSAQSSRREGCAGSLLETGSRGHYCQCQEPWLWAMLLARDMKSS